MNFFEIKLLINYLLSFFLFYHTSDHKLIANLSETNKQPFLSPTSLDDAGAVKLTEVIDLNEKHDFIFVSKMEVLEMLLRKLEKF